MKLLVNEYRSTLWKYSMVEHYFYLNKNNVKYFIQTFTLIIMKLYLRIIMSITNVYISRNIHIDIQKKN